MATPFTLVLAQQKAEAIASKMFAALEQDDDGVLVLLLVGHHVLVQAFGDTLQQRGREKMLSGLVSFQADLIAAVLQLQAPASSIVIPPN